jgi:hypothetical protein
MGMIIAALQFLCTLLGAALSRLFADEAKAWLPHLVERLVSRAVAKLPPDQQERFAEEWRAHLYEVPGELSKLWVAIGFQFAASRMVSALRGFVERSLLAYLIDATAALIMLVIEVPTFLVVGLAIKLESPGPIFVRVPQKNASGHARLVWKFRTVRLLETLDAGTPEDEEAEKLKTSFLQTVTGAILSRSAIVELPTLLDVLKGDFELDILRRLNSLWRSIWSKPD